MSEPELVCDFCSAPDPVVEYPAEEVDLPGLTTSIGSWCACEECRKRIDENDVDGLVYRSFDRLPLDDELRELPSLTLISIRRTQAMFWRSRTGGARAIRRTPLHGRRFVR